MTIEADLSTIVNLLERIAQNTTPVAALSPSPSSESVVVATLPFVTPAPTEPKKRGRPPKAAVSLPAAPEPVVPAEPEPVEEVVHETASEAPVDDPAESEPTPEPEDDFLDEKPAIKPATIEDVRAELLAYKARKGPDGSLLARKLLQHLTGVDKLGDFKDESKYAAVIRAVKAAG